MASTWVLLNADEQLAHAVEQLHGVLARKEMVAVVRDEIRVALRRQVGHREAQRVMQAEADGVRGPLARRHRQARCRARPPGCSRTMAPAESMIVPSQSNTSSP